MGKLLALFIFLLFSLGLSPQVRAADLNIDCPGGGVCNKSGLDPLFNSTIDGVWYPGRVLTKTLNLTNSSSDLRTIALKGTRISLSNILEDVMEISIIPLGGPVLWAGSLVDFYSQDKIELGIFSSGADKDYSLMVSMNLGADNSYQNLETVFSLTLGFWDESSFLENGGMGGTGEVSTLICSEAVPGGTPVLLSATVSGPNQVTLTWEKAKDPLTYYLIAYGTSSGVMQYGNPNIGGPDTTSYTIKDLSGGITYYFKVRAGNGCMPGPFSNELSVTPGGRIISNPPAGFVEGVLGANTKEPTPTPEVLGESSQSSFPKVLKGGFFNSLWDFILWLILGILIVLFYLSRKIRKI